MPVISIIVPVYNSEKYLHRCMESILAQTFKDFEVILINDGSTDNSGGLCDQYKQSDDRVKVIHQSNQGQAAARNNALDLARGDFIGFVDSDDFIHPQMYEILLNNAMQYNANISIGGCCSIIEPKVEKSEISHVYGKTWTGKEYLRYALLSKESMKMWILCDKIFRRECFSEIRMPEGRIYEDNAVVYRLIYESDIIVDCNAPLYYYCYNPQSTVNQKFQRKHMDWLLVLQEMIEYFEQRHDQLLLNKVNQSYLFSLEDMYRKVHCNLKDKELEADLKRKLAFQYHKEKKKYHISIKTHPGLFEVLFPAYSYLYWSTCGIMSKLKRYIHGDS